MVAVRINLESIQIIFYANTLETGVKGDIFFTSRRIRESFRGLQAEMNLNFNTERCVTHAQTVFCGHSCRMSRRMLHECGTDFPGGGGLRARLARGCGHVRPGMAKGAGIPAPVLPEFPAPARKDGCRD